MITGKIKEILDIPYWLVDQGHGSFITFQFGQPHLAIREPKNNSKSKSMELKYREVYVCGEWQLWIY